MEIYLATPSPSPSAARQCHLGGVFGVVIMLENCRLAQFLKGEHYLLLQNVTVHVGIHVSLNKPQLPVPVMYSSPVQYQSP